MKNKNIEKKFLPEGYRYLKEGEPIKQGDCFWGDKNNKWSKVKDPGDKAIGSKEQVIRKR
tara:strand:- start:8 stop:187 length:180 start_codon:yes stop_codon:yes gene_type:complete